MLAQLLAAVLASGADAGALAFMPKVEGLPAPLGRVGDVVEDVKPGGYPAHERVVVTSMHGCKRQQAFFLSRFLAGAAQGALQAQSWLEAKGPRAPRGLSQRLFSRARPLEAAAARARKSVPSDKVPCERPAVGEGWKLLPESSPLLCSPDGGVGGQAGLYAFADPGDGERAAAVVLLTPAPPGREDACRVRLSAVLFDSTGKARFRYHADFGAALSADILGDRCQAAELVFEASSQSFRPVLRKVCLR